MTPWLLMAGLAAASTGQLKLEDTAPLRGARVYARMCAVCHGPEGKGYAADNAPGIGDPAYLAAVSDAFLRRAIAEGRAGTTMSSWAAERAGPLSSSDIGDVVAYLRGLDTGKHEPLDESPVQGSTESGKALFALHCEACHGLDGQGGAAVRIGDPALLADASNGMLRRAIYEGRGSTMPAFGQTLGEGGVEDLVAWLRALQARGSHTPPAPAAPAPPLPLGLCPAFPKGPEPVGISAYPAVVGADAIKKQVDRRSKLCILDARAQSDYLNEHIPGAVSVPFFDPGPYLAALPKDTWLVAYCACPHAESGQLAAKLQAAGFKKVTVLDEGFGYWKSKGYGKKSGPDP